MAKVVMVMGLPASGKSSISKKYIEQNYVHLNRDTEGGKVIDLLPKMKALLADGKDVVLDNLFTSPEDRQPFIHRRRENPYFSLNEKSLPCVGSERSE